LGAAAEPANTSTTFISWYVAEAFALTSMTTAAENKDKARRMVQTSKGRAA
jgi:hypothetical protein